MKGFNLNNKKQKGNGMINASNLYDFQILMNFKIF